MTHPTSTRSRTWDGSMPDDATMVEQLLGRAPMGQFVVTVRRHDRSPVVVANAPLFENGRPMPTRFWLCDPDLVHAISQLESDGGVKQAGRDVDPAALKRTHALAAAERDALLPRGHTGPAPLWRRRWHAPGRQVPPHPLRQLSRRCARRGRRLGEGPAGRARPVL